MAESEPVPDLIVGADGLARPRWAAADELMRAYYDTEWGMPIRDETGLFERLSLEAFQSGLSWATVLRKRAAFREAFAGFDPDAVAAFGDDDAERLLGDARIIRNRAKILATIGNARPRSPCGGGRAGRPRLAAPAIRDPRPDDARRDPDHVAGVARAVEGAEGARIPLRRPDDDVRAHGGGRHRRHAPRRQPSPRHERGVARYLTAPSIMPLMKCRWRMT